MDKNLLVFVTVVEQENFSRAAKELHMTQPAVSQYIRMLEEDVGTRLLERTNKYVRLNKAGEVVYHHAKEIIGLYTKMENLLDDITNKAKGILTIGASYTFGEYVLPHIIAMMQNKYPGIQPTITIGNTAHITELVLTHQLDIGIIEGMMNGVHLEKTPFADDQLYIVASPNNPLTTQPLIKKQDLEQSMWIIREEGSGTRESLENLFAELTIKPERTMKFSSTQPIKEAVAAGLGISLLSKWAIQKELKHHELIILPVEGTPYHRQFSYITMSPFQTKALKLFISLLHDSDLSESIKRKI
ncbi:LysR family transcriptional regulator [Virgibacillus soli]|uniref:LysR family transcriptional regulator n=1 Tax=Paracerasibacillus soli TaxID=480284 RepID=A0ABU5CVN6_9BACI|nr:LysR family transcriptional regulator [Virgibacillus soli]MDY0410315.1 LysR family transcriptional regulator [Virgibacillus soli]